jgi:hypothetical protein
MMLCSRRGQSLESTQGLRWSRGWTDDGWRGSSVFADAHAVNPLRNERCTGIGLMAMASL